MVLAEIRPKDVYDSFHRDVVRDLFYTNRPYIKVQALTPRLANLASTIGGEHNNLSPADTVHIATALSEKVDIFYTLDGSHEHGKRRKTDILDYDGKIGKPPLKIKVPVMPLNSQLLMT